MSKASVWSMMDRRASEAGHALRFAIMDEAAKRANGDVETLEAVVRRYHDWGCVFASIRYKYRGPEVAFDANPSVLVPFARWILDTFEDKA